MNKYAKIENGVIRYYNPFIDRDENGKLTLSKPEEYFINNGWYKVITNFKIGETNIDEENKIINIYSDSKLVKQRYEQDIINKIRKKYSIDEELAILRQRDTKPDEFKEYFDFCESVKTEFKTKYNIN